MRGARGKKPFPTCSCRYQKNFSIALRGVTHSISIARHLELLSSHLISNCRLVPFFSDEGRLSSGTGHKSSLIHIDVIGIHQCSSSPSIPIPSAMSFYIENKNVGNKDSLEDWRSAYFQPRDSLSAITRLEIQKLPSNSPHLAPTQSEDTTHSPHRTSSSTTSPKPPPPKRPCKQPDKKSSPSSTTKTHPNASS